MGNGRIGNHPHTYYIRTLDPPVHKGLLLLLNHQQQYCMQPHRIKVGASVILVSLDGLAADWGVEEKHILRMLHQFGEIPLVTPMEGGKQYVSLYSLETALFEAGLPVAFQGGQTLVRTHQELCGVLYGTLTKEVIRERCKALAAALRRPSAATVKYPGKTKGMKRTRSR